MQDKRIDKKLIKLVQKYKDLDLRSYTKYKMFLGIFEKNLRKNNVNHCKSMY